MKTGETVKTIQTSYVNKVIVFKRLLAIESMKVLYTKSVSGLHTLQEWMYEVQLTKYSNIQQQLGQHN